MAGIVTDDEILDAAREHMKAAYDADIRNRERDIEDRRFASGDQYPEADRTQRELDGRPCLTVNAVAHHVRMVTAQIRGMNPAVKVSPSDDAASKEVAEIIEGMIRDAEQRCDAPSVYESAAESAAQGGIGYFRLRTDYCDPLSFDQEFVIEPIYNPFSVFVDPFARHPTRMDMQFCFLVEEMPKEDFEKAYPDAAPFDVTSDHRPYGSGYWSRGNSVVVAEYYWIEHKDTRISLMPDGTVVKGKVPGAVQTRTARVPSVKWAKISGDAVLDGPLDIPGRYIPVFAVTGEEINLGEEVIRSGVIRHAKDPQVLYNLAMSAQAEVVSLQPKAPYVVTPKQVAGLEDMWATANTSNRPYLVYNPDEKAPGRPQRETPPIASQGWMAVAQQAADDIKRCTGIYDASLGARSNETSGVAIAQRKQESQSATSIYADNMVKAIRQCGQVMVDQIPHVYDTQRMVRTVGHDGAEKPEMVNKLMISERGEVIMNDLRRGKYAVRVSVGPAYETMRAEAREGMMQFLQAVPVAGQVTADLVAAAQDWPNAEEFADRLKKTLPPGLVEGDEPPSPEQQQAMAQQQAIQQAQMQMEMQKAEADTRKAMADAAESEADAGKAQAETMRLQLETMAMTGQLDAAIAAIVQQQVARALMSATAPQGAF